MATKDHLFQKGVGVNPQQGASVGIKAHLSKIYLIYSTP